MLIRLLGDSLRRRTRRAAVAILAISVGTALAAALLGISLDITEKMAREMRSYGANILATPDSGDVQLEVGGITIRPPAARGGIDETQLVKLKTIFWRNNVVGFAPFLSAIVEVRDQQVALTGTWFDRTLTLPAGASVRTGADTREKAASTSTFRTGVRVIAPWWQVEGKWANDEDPGAAMVGSALARRLGLRVGDAFTAHYAGRPLALRAVGLVSTGGYEDEQIFVGLTTAQGLLGLSRGADKVLVSALVEPDDRLRPDLRGRDPAQMTPEQYATWYCSPIMGAIVTQVKEVLPNADVRPIRQIAEAEGGFLSKVGLLMTLLTATALAASALAVMTAMTASVLERRTEIGLMKAIGADAGQIALVFLSEAGLMGLVGGLLGYVAGLALAAFVGQQVFAAAVSPPPAVLPVSIALALGVALAGSALPVRQAVRLDPVSLLRGR
ncbi:MAG: ABC transporter permease [Chloroflexi bacterium]|nr:ABC transporter permease [Chloroflexota bacterium]